MPTKGVFLDLSECNALGDTLCATAVLKKLYESYESKIGVVSKYPDIFKNNPYVGENYHSDNINLDYLKSKFIVHNSFYNIGKKNEKGVEYKHNVMDIRQFHAVNLGFMLTKHEMELIYKPDQFQPIENIPEKYILIHPVQNWASRTWSAENWMRLTELLNNMGYAVVSIGKESSETGFFNVNKPTFNFEITNGLNLMNKTDISQAWHLIDKAEAFVTMDSGLLHLAATTKAYIIHLGSSINPEFRKPYRDGMGMTIADRYSYVSGECKLLCASNMKYGVREWGNIQGVPPLVGCLENKSTYECHPTVEQVIEYIR
jgi:ADP-heptose:LPS heptosyltransferase